MKYFVDSEFIDTGEMIDLISIGIISDDGRELYLQSTEFNEDNANQWIKDNVLSHLANCGVCPETPRAYHDSLRGFDWWDISKHPKHVNCPWRPRRQIAKEVAVFCDPEKYGKPELIGWCASYDFVVLCQLFGTMMDLPVDFPHYIKDLQHVLDDRSWTDDMLPEQDGSVHNALADARHHQRVWEFLNSTN